MQINQKHDNYPSSSIRRFQVLQKQQQQISKAFQIQNFYENKKINIEQLKQKIQQFKHKKISSIQIDDNYKQKNTKQRNNMSLQYQTLKKKKLQKRDIKTNQYNRNGTAFKNNNQFQGKRQKYIKSNIQSYNKTNFVNPENSLFKIKKQKTKDKQDKSNSNHSRVSKFKIHPIVSSKNPKKKTQNKHQNSCEFSETSTNGIFRNIQQKRIIINSEQKLIQFQIMILQLWNLYELLTKIMCGVLTFPFQQQKAVQKYVQAVSSNKFEYIKDVMLQCLNKRFHKAIITSKLLQNVSIVYLVLQLYKRKKIRDSHITNFIGYCTSNIIFIIRIMHLIHDIKNNSSGVQTHQGTQKNMDMSRQSLQLSERTKEILCVIKQFQINSYKQQLNSLSDIILRMEHNNEVINIVESRLCQKTEKQVQNILADFLKVVIYQKYKPFYEYSHYIFQFLAYHIASQHAYGIIKSVQIAPQPYLALKYLHTVVIEPYGVLVFQKNKNIYIRAHAETFIDVLSNYCNVIFWSDMMPSEIDPILQLFPKKQNISYLYKYHCRQENQRFVKPLERIGSRLDNTIIIDKFTQNFEDDKQNGIQFGWKGQKKDIKLLALLNLLEPLFGQEKPLRRSLYTIRAQILLLSKKKQVPLNLRRQKFMSPSQDQPSACKTPNSQFLPSFNDYQHKNHYRKQYQEQSERNKFVGQKQQTQQFQLPMMVTRSHMYRYDK